MRPVTELNTIRFHYVVNRSSLTEFSYTIRNGGPDDLVLLK
jgi:hypothetical protein